MDYPDILHHSAKDGVPGSCHQLLMDAEHSLLLDCGLFHGAETSAEGKSAAADRLDIEFYDQGPGCHPRDRPYWAHSLPAGHRFQKADSVQRAFGQTAAHCPEDAFKLGFSRDPRHDVLFIGC